MGLDIGAAARAIAPLPPAGFTQRDRGRLPGETRGEEAGQLVRGPEEPEIRAGFGENTLSPPGAALETLDTNLEVAGQLVPTVEELRARARVNQAERADALAARAGQERPEEVRQRETLRPEPNPAARNFLIATEELAVAEPPELETDPAVDQQPLRQERGAPVPVPPRLDIRI